MMKSASTPRRFLCAVTMTLLAAAAHAGDISLPAEAGGQFSVKVTSLLERRFTRTIKQQYDFSCGSAALATLLKYHYEHPVTEQQVFSKMFEKGDQRKIQREGFSLLDMKLYLEANGYQADGFRFSLDRLAELKVPAIALINDKGYKHFVVVKAVSGDQVLLGDPAVGVRALPRRDFEGVHHGIFFLIRNHSDIAQRHYSSDSEWRVKVAAPLDMAISRDLLSNVTVLLPGPNDR